MDNILSFITLPIYNRKIKNDYILEKYYLMDLYPNYPIPVLNLALHYRYTRKYYLMIKYLLIAINMGNDSAMYWANITNI